MSTVYALNELITSVREQAAVDFSTFSIVLAERIASFILSFRQHKRSCPICSFSHWQVVCQS